MKGMTNEEKLLSIWLEPYTVEYLILLDVINFQVTSSFLLPPQDF